MSKFETYKKTAKTEAVLVEDFEDIPDEIEDLVRSIDPRSHSLQVKTKEEWVTANLPIYIARSPGDDSHAWPVQPEEFEEWYARVDEEEDGPIEVQKVPDVIQIPRRFNAKQKEAKTAYVTAEGVVGIVPAKFGVAIDPDDEEVTVENANSFLRDASRLYLGEDESICVIGDTQELAKRIWGDLP